MNTADPQWVLYTVEGFDSQPTLEAVASHIGVSVEYCDPEFGVVLLDPQRGMYCVQIAEKHHPRITDGSSASGPWATPPIRGFHQ